MDMKHVTTGKYAVYIRLQTFIHYRTGCHRIQLYSYLGRKFILRDQSTGQKQGITIIIFFCTRNRLAILIYLCKCYTFHALLSFDVYHCVTQLQRNTIIIQTLHDITFQTAGIWHQLCYHLNLGTLQRHTSRHDQSDISGTQDHNLFTRHSSFHIDVSLCSSCGINTRRTITRNIQCTSGTLSASHCQNHCFCLNLEQTLFFIHYSNNFIPGHIHNNRMKQIRNLHFLYLFNISSGILRSGQFFLKCMQSKSVMYALIQNTTKFIISLYDQDILYPCLSGCNCCRQSCRSSPDDCNLCLHLIYPPYRNLLKMQNLRRIW